MSDETRKPDDAPVTWGELRQVVNLLGELGVVSSTYAVQGINPARDEDRFKKTEARVLELGQILTERFIKGPENG